MEYKLLLLMHMGSNTKGVARNFLYVKQNLIAVVMLHHVIYISANFKPELQLTIITLLL